MQDEPRPEEILAAVARYLRETVAPATSGHVSFNVRVCANALEMSRRQLLDPDSEAERGRLEALLGEDGDLAALNAELCRRIAAGEATLETPGLTGHLWETTLAKLAVDQPTYWGYRAALAAREDRAFSPSSSSPLMGEVAAERPEGVEQPPHPSRPSVGPPSPSRGGRIP